MVVDAITLDVIIDLCWDSILKLFARPVTPLTTYAIIERASIKTMMFLLDNRYQEKKALARRPSVIIQSPVVYAMHHL